ncbi:hypothetical protein B14911_07740 [Bacillus sp. NRRL B-14911]|nr:hypothetical protein B14911_07740 [Bacillus sp. NRRL B-14911]
MNTIRAAAINLEFMAGNIVSLQVLLKPIHWASINLLCFAAIKADKVMVMVMVRACKTEMFLSGQLGHFKNPQIHKQRKVPVYSVKA